MFADEARFGRRNLRGHGWANIGSGRRLHANLFVNSLFLLAPYARRTDREFFWSCLRPYDASDFLDTVAKKYAKDIDRLCRWSRQSLQPRTTSPISFYNSPALLAELTPQENNLGRNSIQNIKNFSSNPGTRSMANL